MGQEEAEPSDEPERRIGRFHMDATLASPGYRYRYANGPSHNPNDVSGGAGVGDR